jgi:UDP-3-O-[3-hydroxymyristoyl] glucosamine N-acyltransferase
VTPLRLSTQAVADLVGGRLLGDGEVVLEELAPLERAGPRSLGFLVAARYLAAFARSSAGAVLMAEEFASETRGPKTRIVVTDPADALARAAAAFAPPGISAQGIDPTARVSPDASLGQGVTLGPFVVVEEGARIGDRTRLGAGTYIGAGVTLGEDCLLGPHVVCYQGSRLGNRVSIKAGAVVGGSGFGFLPGTEGHRRLPNLGSCVLGDDVEVGSQTCIDRGTFDDTVIGRGTKVDNLVQVGHNVRIGARCLIMATTGIAGSVSIGDDVVITGGVGIADHAVIEDRVTIGAKSVIFATRIAAGSVVSGYPARSHREFLRAQAALYRLAPLVAKLEAVVEGQVVGAPPHA